MKRISPAKYYPAKHYPAKILLAKPLLAKRSFPLLFARLLIALALLGTHVFSGSTALAQQANQAFGRLGQYLPQTGTNDTWRFANANNSFEIENIGAPNAITYFYIGPEDGTEGRRTIETTLSIHPDSKGSAGLIYGLDRDRGLYHMLTLDASGTVRLFRRDNDGFRAMMEMTSSAFQPEKLNTLKIVEDGNQISYFVNDTSLGGVGGDRFGFGGVGIGAVGDVRAFYTLFSDKPGKDRTDLNPPREMPGTQRGPVQEPVETAQTSTKIPNDALELRPVQIMDQNGPAGRPVVAYETLIPVGWKTQGGVVWNQNDGAGRCFTGARVIWGVSSPDESYSLFFLEPMSWGVTTAGRARYSCMQQDLPNAEMAMRAYFNFLNQNGRSGGVSVEPLEYRRPAELRPLVDSFAQNWRTSVAGSQAWTDGVMTRSRITNNGRKSDGLSIAITKHLAMSSSVGSFRSGNTAVILAFSTPEGKLEQLHPAFGAILNNMRPNPQWLQLEAQWWQQKKGALGGAIDGQIAANASSGKSIGDSMFESWKRRQNMKDAGQSKSVNGIWEVQPWKSPSGNTVLLNQNYNHAWQLQNGSIVMTNNANFNPMQTFNQTGQQLQPGF